MSKKVFTFFMIVETLADLVAMGLMFSDVGALIYPISLVLFAAVLAPFCLWLKKVPEEAKKRKIRLGMVLIMLIPSVVAIALIACVVIALAMYYGF